MPTKDDLARLLRVGPSALDALYVTLFKPPLSAQLKYIIGEVERFQTPITTVRRAAG